MTPLEKCVAILAALATADARGSLTVASAEIDAFTQRIEGGKETTARALDELAYKLSVAAPPTNVAAEIGHELQRRIHALTVPKSGRTDPSGGG